MLGPLLGQQPPTSFHFLQNPIGFPYVESFDLVTDGPNGPQFVAVGFDGSFTLVDHSTGPFPQDLVGEGFVTTSVFTVDCDGFVLVYTQPPLIDVLDPTYPWEVVGDTTTIQGSGNRNAMIKVLLNTPNPVPPDKRRRDALLGGNRQAGAPYRLPAGLGRLRQARRPPRSQ